MTVVSLFSLKGAPGVTTLASLLGAAWAGARPVVLVEADPAGGDLAARFGLSARVGWSSLASSTRRSGGIPSLDPHLQTLPGGLPVLVAARGPERRPAATDEGAAIRSGPGGTSEESPGLTIVDLGRLGADDAVSESWLDVSDASLVVVRGDVSSAVHLRDRVEHLAAACQGRLGTVVVAGDYSGRDLQDFTGLASVADVPFDPAAAAVACGGTGSGRRLERSPLWLAVVRLAVHLESRSDRGGDRSADTMASEVAAADALSASDVPAADRPVGPPRVAADPPAGLPRATDPGDGPPAVPSRNGQRRLRGDLRRVVAGASRPGTPERPADDVRRMGA